MSAPAPRHYAWAALAVLGLGALLQLLLGWTAALPAVDCYGTLMQVSRDPRVIGHAPPSFVRLGMEPGRFWDQVGAVYAGTGRAYVGYLAYIDTVALLGGLHAMVWHALNTFCVTATIALLWSILQRVSQRPALGLALLVLLFAPFADPHGLDLFGYLTSAEAPGLLFVFIGLRLALVPGWPAALGSALALLTAVLTKESVLAFLPLAWALRYHVLAETPSGPRVLRTAVRALVPPLMTVVALVAFMVAMRRTFPPVGPAYVGVAGMAARGKPIATVVVSFLQLCQQFLPIGVPPDGPRGIVALVVPRLVAIAALLWLAHTFGWRRIDRTQWSARGRDALVGLAGIAAICATFLAYWLLGRMPPSDFHVAPAVFAAALTVSVAGNFFARVAPLSRAWRPACALAVLALIGCAAQGPRVTLYLAIAIAFLLAAVVMWQVRRSMADHTPHRAVALGLLLLLFVPRLPVLAANRADVALAADEVQGAVAQMVAQPTDATVHVELASAGWIEYAWALRGYTTLLGRSDLRLCITVVDDAYEAGNAAYVRRLIDTARSDDAQRPRTPTTLTVSVRRGHVDTAAYPVQRAVVSTGPTSACAFP